MTARPTERLEELRQRAYTDFAELVRRAQAAGELRADFVPEDFILLVLANQGVLRGTGDAARLASQRFLGLVLDGCRAAGAHALPAPPPAQRYAATQGLVRPEHRFPAPLDNRVTAYRWLLKQGFSAENIAGDSAGGNLTITTLMKLRDNGDPLPAAAAALSPVADLSDKDELFRDVRDPLLQPRAAGIFNRSYVAHGDARDPLISPVFGDWRGLPPLLVHAGADEVRRDDAVRIEPGLVTTVHDLESNLNAGYM